MIRVGIVEFGTSHVVAFTQRWNHVDCTVEQWVEGARVVAGWPGSSYISLERVPEHARQLEAYGVELVDQAEDLIDRVDEVCIESGDGSVHLERVRPFIEARLPVFIDKPLACSVDDALDIVSLASARSAWPHPANRGSRAGGLECLAVRNAAAQH